MNKVIFRLKLILTHVVWVLIAGWMILYSDWLSGNMGALPFIVLGILTIQWAIWRDEWRGISWQLTHVDNRQSKLYEQQSAELREGLQQIHGDKNGTLTKALKNLSDDELVRLKAGLQNGTIDDAMLFDEIEKQKRS